jgi:hypothetical protein
MTNVCQVIEKYGPNKREVCLEIRGEKHNSLNLVCHRSPQHFHIFASYLGSTEVCGFRPVGWNVMLSHGATDWLVIAKQKQLEERVYFRARVSDPGWSDYFSDLVITDSDSEWTRHFPDSIPVEWAAKDRSRVEFVMKTLSELKVLCQDLMLPGAFHGTLRSEGDVERKSASWGFVVEGRATSRLSLTSRRCAGMA